MKNGIASDEHGHPVKWEDFPYEEVFSQDNGMDLAVNNDALKELTPAEIESGLKVMDGLLRWVWQGGMKNSDGIKVRSILLCWICLKQLRPYSMTDTARMFGLDKQSLGRWLDQFKIKFPNVPINQMRNK